MAIKNFVGVGVSTCCQKGIDRSMVGSLAGNGDGDANCGDVCGDIVDDAICFVEWSPQPDGESCVFVACAILVVAESEFAGICLSKRMKRSAVSLRPSAELFVYR
jgi:hypothetical protein